MSRNAPRHHVRRLAAGFAGVAALSASLLVASPAQADAGDPFSTDTPTIFVAQNIPTGLFTATSSGTGTISFDPEGPAAGLQYNAIGFDESSGYIYGIASTDRAATTGVTAVDAGALIRIGQDGVVTQVGTATHGVNHVGAMYDGHLYINRGDFDLRAIDIATGEEDLTRSKTLTALPDVSDFTELDGYFWSISSAGEMVRINPADGQVDKFASPVTGTSPWVFGAAWTFGNGNLGFSNNNSGLVRQISVSGADSASPSFTLVATSPGPDSGNNDGTAALGAPADLGIVKSGPSSVVAGMSISYDLTVTNEGPGTSSGFVVSDTIPAQLSNVASSDPACSVVGDTVTCVGGVLDVGASQTFTITADVDDSFSGDLDNTATVTGNEADPTPGNNTSTFTTDVQEPAPSLTVTKHASLNDTNGNGTADADETIDYSFTVKNTGNVDLTDVTIDDPKVSGLDPASADIDAGDEQEFVADPYIVTDDDVESGEVANTATASGTDPFGGTVVSDPSSTSTDTTPAAGADPDDSDAALPDTGAPMWLGPMLAAALAMIVVGAWLVRRRREPGRHAGLV